MSTRCSWHQGRNSTSVEDVGPQDSPVSSLRAVPASLVVSQPLRVPLGLPYSWPDSQRMTGSGASPSALVEHGSALTPSPFSSWDNQAEAAAGCSLWCQGRERAAHKFVWVYCWFSCQERVSCPNPSSEWNISMTC